MRTLQELGGALRRIDGRGYRAYKGIEGRYAAGRFVLALDHAQGDPFSDPSRVRALLPAETARLPEWALRSDARRVAAADFLNRTLARALRGRSTPRGSGSSGRLTVLEPGQEVLERSAVRLHRDGALEARFRVGLPADGRRIRGADAAEMLTRLVPAAVEEALCFASLDAAALRRHVETVEDARALRAQLEERGLVAFVADGAVLPRRSGVDDRPLGVDDAVPFVSPAELRVALEAPNAGTVEGMGVPRGITLVVGGGFHGKSTLLRAIERGVYDHVPGDGRECVVALATAVKVRAEDGRAVTGTDISNFIAGLPAGQDTGHFYTRNASGSTSQAAAIAEALEVGARCLLLDEDTSATNFMIRDARMQALIADGMEPITPFIDRARQLYEEEGVSCVLVVGGSGDYFDVADTVIAMHEYRPADVTREAKRIARELPTGRHPAPRRWQPLSPRIPLPGSLDPARGSRRINVRTPADRRLVFGTEEVDLSAVEQLVERAQARTIALALAWARGRAIDGEHAVPAALETVMEVLAREGFDAVQEEPTGELAGFRVFEMAAVLSRIRSLEARPAE